MGFGEGVMTIAVVSLHASMHVCRVRILRKRELKYLV